MIYFVPKKIENDQSDAGDEYGDIAVESDCWSIKVCELASKSVLSGGGPFAAIILQVDSQTGEVLGEWSATNSVTKTCDPTAHAEVNVIRKVCAELNIFHLNDETGKTFFVLYSSCEPCPMCLSAIYWAKIPNLFFVANRYDASNGIGGFLDAEIYEELNKPFAKRKIKCYNSQTNNSTKPFELWKESEARIDY
jgi:tRNA(Arg) A34 adenosine deaminase TadA